jgi:3-oxoadipate enol-lactonase
VPFINTSSTRLFYRLEGKAELPVLVLSHSLGCDLGMWDPQMPAMLERFRVLRYDTRGHGASDVPPGDYTIEMLGRDVLELCAAEAAKRFAFCGISMGGAVGQWLAIHAPEKVTALVLANTSPRFGTREAWNIRLQAVRAGGIEAIVDAGMERFFSPANRSSVWSQTIRRVLLGTDAAGYAACCVALRDLDFTEAVAKIGAPTLVIGSDADPSTPWEGNGSVLSTKIRGARSVMLAGAHLSNLEQPSSFTAAVVGFLSEHLSQVRAKNVL